MKRGQGAFEYTLLLAGILLVAVIAVVILRESVLPSANKAISDNVNAYNQLTCFKTWQRDPINAVGVWNLDEGTGSTASDLSSSRATLALQNNPTWATTDNCRSGRCLSFIAASNQYAEITGTSSPAHLRLNGPSGLTLSFWIYQTGTTENNGGLVGTNGIGATSGYQCVYTTSPANRVRCYINNVFVESGTLATNAWHHVAFTWDGTVGDALGATLYINGAEADTTTSGNIVNPTNWGTFRIGRQGTADFNGRIDEVAVYRKSLTLEEVTADYRCRG